MRTIFLLFTICSVADLSAQVAYDPNVAKQYDSLFKKLSPGVQKTTEDAQKDAGNPGSIVICTAFIDDTLNLSDVRPDYKQIKIYDSTGKLAEAIDESMPVVFPMLIFNSLKSDTLNIEVTPWIMSEQTIRHKIKGKYVSTVYEEFYKDDNILRAHDGAPITNDLIVPATTVKFVLSDKIFVVGKTIYGQADVITRDFLFEAAPGFKYNIMRHRFHFKYFFKIKLSQVASSR